MSECGEEAAPALESTGAGCTLGAPSTWIFLVGLHLCRARLRFSRQGRLSTGESGGHELSEWLGEVLSNDWRQRRGVEGTRQR